MVEILGDCVERLYQSANNCGKVGTGLAVGSTVDEEARLPQCAVAHASPFQ